MSEQPEESINSLIEMLLNQQVSRGKFLRLVTLLGFSVGTAEFLGGCTPRRNDQILGDPMECVYEVDYITTTPEKRAETFPTTEDDLQKQPTETPRPQVIRWYCSSCGRNFPTLQDYQKACS
ncbi:MAG: hypothetical protein U5K99_04130 [Anaerolineales bacterium]|nr:hypothetical protein [Anaerolineales bacterium]